MVPHGFLVAPRHVLRSHANGPMTRGIVPFHESRQFVEELKGVGGREIPIESFFQGAIEPFHQRRFGIPVRREMMDPVFLGPLLERAVVEFFASIRLQTVGATPLTQDLVKGLDHSHPGLGFQGLDPRVLGQRIDHGHQVPYPAVVLGQGLHFHQIDDPLIVQSAHDHRQPGKTASAGFVQGVSQILFQDALRFFQRQLVSLGKSTHPSQTGSGAYVVVFREPLGRRIHSGLLLFPRSHATPHQNNSVNMDGTRWGRSFSIFRYQWQAWGWLVNQTTYTTHRKTFFSTWVCSSTSKGGGGG